MGLRVRSANVLLSPMIDHIGMAVRNFEKSKKFYNEALATLGYRLVLDLADHKAAGYGTDRPEFWIGEGAPTNGSDEVHVSFVAKDRKAVVAFYEAALRAGAKDNGKPGLRPEYAENYYGAFVLDPDGYNIEACCRLPE